MDYFIKELSPDAEISEEIVLSQIPSFTQSDLEGGVGNCSLTAIVRLLACFGGEDGEKRLDEKALYQRVKELALVRGYKEAGRGTPFYRIAGVLTAALREYGIPGRGKSRYIWSLREVKRELKRGKPLIFNIAFGHYKNHTVTVVGYKRVRFGAEEKDLLCVCDGWSRTERYIDFRHIHIGSLTVVG